MTVTEDNNTDERHGINLTPTEQSVKEFLGPRIEDMLVRRWEELLRTRLPEDAIEKVLLNDCDDGNIPPDPVQLAHHHLDVLIVHLVQSSRS